LEFWPRRYSELFHKNTQKRQLKMQPKTDSSIGFCEGEPPDGGASFSIAASWRWALTGGLAQKDQAGTQSEIEIKRPGQECKQKTFSARITYGRANIAPSHRVPIGKVDKRLVLHPITGDCHMSNICKPQSYHIVSYHLGFCSTIENCNANHSE
jgi:hypothetical protein